MMAGFQGKGHMGGPSDESGAPGVMCNQFADFVVATEVFCVCTRVPLQERSSLHSKCIKMLEASMTDVLQSSVMSAS